MRNKAIKLIVLSSFLPLVLTTPLLISIPTHGQTSPNNNSPTLNQKNSENSNSSQPNIEQTSPNNGSSTSSQENPENSNSSQPNIEQTSPNNGSPTSSQENSENSNSSQPNIKKLIFIIIIFSILGLGIIILSITNTLLIRDLKRTNKELFDKIRKRKTQIQELENRDQNRNEQIIIFDKRIKDLKNSSDNQSLQLKQLEFQINNLLLKNQITQTIQQDNFSTISDISPEKSLSAKPEPEYLRLTNSYRENPQSLIQNAIRVSMTKETVNKVLAGTWEGLIELESNSRQGEFYIVSSNGGESYLFLDPNTLFNTQILQQINKSQLFICNGSLSQKLKGSDINIIKPAIVEKNVENNWVFVQSGEINLV